MSYTTQSANAKFYWGAISIICGYAIGAYDKSHSFLVLQKLGASVTAIHLLVAGIILFYTVTALKLIKDRAQLSLSRFGEALQNVSEQASSDITKGVTELEELGEQIKAELDILNIRDIHDKLGRIAQSIQIAAAKPQPGQSNKDKQKSPSAQNTLPETKQSRGSETQKQVDSAKQPDAPRNENADRPRNDSQNSTMKAPISSPEQKVPERAKHRKQDNVPLQQTVSHLGSTTKSLQPPEKLIVSNPSPVSSKEFRPEPQPPVKEEVNDEAFV